MTEKSISTNCAEVYIKEGIPYQIFNKDGLQLEDAKAPVQAIREYLFEAIRRRAYACNH